jgi:hypothetical protein
LITRVGRGQGGGIYAGIYPMNNFIYITFCINFI